MLVDIQASTRLPLDSRAAVDSYPGILDAARKDAAWPTGPRF